MKITFIANACCIYESNGFRLAADPWLIDGAFEGSWCHYPPLKTRPEDLATIDALFISHLHPDHLDPASLVAVPRDLPVVVLDHGRNYLHRILPSLGFTNLVKVTDGATVELGPFRLSVFAPFAKHVFHESAIGNFVDSALVVEADGQIVLNANDNALDLDAARALRERFGLIDVAQLNYNAAGPYPSCFHNLSLAEKQARHAQVLRRNLDHMVAISQALGARRTMPFAGAYVLGGRQWRKNAVLGTTTVDAAGAAVGAGAVVMSEGGVFDLATGGYSGAPFQSIDPDEQQAYIEAVLSRRVYDHERDEQPDAADLHDLFRAARANLWTQQTRWNAQADLNVGITVGEHRLCFNYGSAETSIRSIDKTLPEPFIEASMDPRLLHRILTGRAHWNNAEIGCHIDFVRKPDTYLPDFHLMMSFFCLPPTRAAARVSAEPALTPS